jgi:hypothetical protein
MTVDRFCDEYGCGRTRAFQLLRQRKLRGRKFGARTLIERPSAEEWAASLPKWGLVDEFADESPR